MYEETHAFVVLSLSHSSTPVHRGLTVQRIRFTKQACLSAHPDHVAKSSRMPAPNNGTTILHDSK